MNSNSITIKLIAIGAIVIVTLAAMSLLGASPAAIALFGVLGPGFLWLLAIAIGANPKVTAGGATFDASRNDSTQHVEQGKKEGE